MTTKSEFAGPFRDTAEVNEFVTEWQERHPDQKPLDYRIICDEDSPPHFYVQVLYQTY